MTSRELTSGFNFWSGGHIRMVVVHLPIKFGVDICIQSRLLTYFRNSRWRPPPSWIFKSCTFGTFRHVNNMVLDRAGLTYCGTLSTCQSRCPPGPPSPPPLPDKYTVHQHHKICNFNHWIRRNTESTPSCMMYVAHRSPDLFIIEHLSKAEAHILALRSLNLPFKYIITSLFLYPLLLGATPPLPLGALRVRVVCLWVNPALVLELSVKFGSNICDSH